MAAYILLMPSCPFGVYVTAQQRCLWHRPPCARQPQRRLRRSVRGGNDGRSAESDACTSAHTCASPTAIGSIEHEHRRACACVLRPRSLALTRTHSIMHSPIRPAHAHTRHTRACARAHTQTHTRARARAHTHTHLPRQSYPPAVPPSLSAHAPRTHERMHALTDARTHTCAHAHPTHARWLARTHTLAHARRRMV
jgi:hypothetical protein